MWTASGLQMAPRPRCLQAVLLTIAVCCLSRSEAAGLRVLLAEQPATNGTTDPDVLSSIVPPADWDSLPPALEVPGPSKGRYRQDGTLVAVLGSVARTQLNITDGPRPATAMTANRLDNNVCMLVQSTGADRVCKTSPNGRFRFCLQRDANIVLYDGSTAYWASNTRGRTNRLPLRICMQADGNLVAYDNSNAAFWASNSCCQNRRTPMTTFIQDDGNLVAYDGTCSPFWATNIVRAASVPAACSPLASTTRRVTLRESRITTGPFGVGNPSSPAAFDDTTLANGGTNKLSQFEARSGSWIDGIRVRYGTTLTPWRGSGTGGALRPALVLASDEWIQQAWVRSGAFVDEIRFITSKGRYWSTSGDTTQSGDWGMMASPCPASAYRLIAVKGVGGSYLERIEFIWALAPNALGPLVSTVDQWSYLPEESPVFRVGSTGQPQCLSRDGRSCATSKDGFNLRMCGDTLSSSPVTCSAEEGNSDPTHWCNKARGALGLSAPGVPVLALFLNVEVCNSGLAVAESNLRNTLYNDPHSLKNYWRAASAGRAFLDEWTSKVVTLRLPCDSFPITTCDVGTWFNYARDNVVGFNQYKYQVFLAPRTAACDAQGIGFAYGSVSWIRGDFVNDLNIFKHEIGHNFGLPHAGRIIPPSQVEGYGDDTTPMGFCARCIYNSVDQLRLGWSRALPVVDWASFSGSASVTLPALSDAAAYRDLGVVHIRLQTPSDPGVPGGFTRNIYLSYRVTKNQDTGLPAKYSQATSVHGVNGDSWLLAWPKTGQAYVNTANKMVVRQDVGNLNEARVTICKWVTSQSECGSFSTFVRTSVSAASADAPFDRDAYYGKHTWSPLAGANTTANITAGASIVAQHTVAEVAGGASMPTTDDGTATAAAIATGPVVTVHETTNALGLPSPPQEEQQAAAAAVGEAAPAAAVP